MKPIHSCIVLLYGILIWVCIQEIQVGNGCIGIPGAKFFGSSSVLLDVFLRLVGVFFSLRALFPASCYNSTCFFLFCLFPSLYTTPLAYIRSKKKKRARVGILVLLHLHVKGVLFTWLQLWNSRLFSVCGRGVRLLGWLTGSSALLCGRLIVLIACIHYPCFLFLHSILLTCDKEGWMFVTFLYGYLYIYSSWLGL